MVRPVPRGRVPQDWDGWRPLPALSLSGRKCVLVEEGAWENANGIDHSTVSEPPTNGEPLEKLDAPGFYDHEPPNAQQSSRVVYEGLGDSSAIATPRRPAIRAARRPEESDARRHRC